MVLARVRSVLSGDTLVLANSPGSALGNERTLSLAFVTAPRLGADEPYGFQSRELLRSLLVGKSVDVNVMYTINGRDYGDVSAPVFESLIARTLEAGTTRLRDDGKDKAGLAELRERLVTIESAAKASGMGMWADQIEPIATLTQLPAELLGGSNKQYPAVIEKVIAGDRAIVRVVLEPTKHFVGYAALGGIRAPKVARNNTPADRHGDAARLYLADRLLQRSVRLEFLGLTPGSSDMPLITVVHSAGDIIQLLLANGLATVADAQSTTLGPERMQVLRAAQKRAENARVNIWESKAPAPAGPQGTSKIYQALIAKVVSSETYSIVIGTDIDGVEQRDVQLSSLRAPRKNDPAQAPFIPIARDFARKELIGKAVTVQVDGIRPKSDNVDERELVTFLVGPAQTNVALGIVKAGLATVLRHRHDDTARSPIIDELYAAEEDAKTNARGMFAHKPPAEARIVDASESAVRAKGFLNSLERRARIPGVVEHVMSAGRLRIHVPSENCLITVVLAGIRAPRANEPFGEEAHRFVARRLTQREVQVTVKSVDRTGAFVSIVYPGSKKQSLSALLVAQGYAEVHEGSLDVSGLQDELHAAETQAQQAKRGIWADGATRLSAPTTEAASTGGASTEQVVTGYQDAVIVSSRLNLVGFRLKPVQIKYLELEKDLKSFFSGVANAAAQKFEKPPRRGQVVAVDVNGGFKRGKVAFFEGQSYTMDLVDFGSRVKVDASKLRQLPDRFNINAVAPLVSVAPLVNVSPPPKGYEASFREYIQAISAPTAIVISYIAGGGVLVFTEDTRNANDSVNSRIIEQGLSYVAQDGPDSSAALAQRLAELEVTAKSQHKGMWRYGDPREILD